MLSVSSNRNTIHIFILSKPTWALALNQAHIGVIESVEEEAHSEKEKEEMYEG